MTSGEVGTTSEYASSSPTTKEPFGASVDWGGSFACSDTLSVNSSEAYRWFDNEGLESCTIDDECSVISDPVFLACWRSTFAGPATRKGRAQQAGPSEGLHDCNDALTQGVTFWFVITKHDHA